MRAVRRRSGQGTGRLAGAFLALSLLLVACGSTVQGRDTRGAQDVFGDAAAERPAAAGTDARVPREHVDAFALDDIPGVSDEPASTSPGVPTAESARGQPRPGTGPAPPGNGAASSSGDAHPAVTAEAVRVGFIGAENVEEFGAAFGGEGNPFGETNAQIRAVVNYINEHGGVAGRMIEPVVRNSDLTGRADQAESICAGFTQDDKVFAVLSLGGGFDEAEVACYAQNQTLLATAVFFALDQKVFDNLAPYYWSTSGLNLSSMARLMARGLHARGFYDGEKLGVLYNDNATFRRVYDGVLKPELARLGVEITADAGIAPFESLASASDIQADVNNSILRFRSEGIDRVIFLEQVGTISLFWIPAAESQGYRPGYGLVSGNYPQIAAETAHAEAMAKSAAVGYAPAADTNESHMPFPGTPAERRCMELMAREGQHFERRIDALFALYYCDLGFFFQRAGAGAGTSLDHQSWVASAERMSDGFDAAGTPVTSFGPRKHDGATAYRALSFHPECTCWHYEGDVLPLPR